MASTPLEIPALPPGLTLTLDVYPYGNDTAGQTGISLTEETNRKGTYTGNLTASTTGLVTCKIKSGSTVIAEATGHVLADDTTTYIMDGKLRVETDGQGHADVKEIEGTDATDQIRDAIVSDATRFPGAAVTEARLSELDAGTSGKAAAEIDRLLTVILTGITAANETDAGKHSVAALVMIGTNASLAGTTLTAKKPSDDSTFQTYTVTTDNDADPVTGVS